MRRKRVANESTYWLFFELLWREFFRFVSRLNGPKLFWCSGIKEAGDIRTKGRSENIAALERRENAKCLC